MKFPGLASVVLLLLCGILATQFDFSRSESPEEGAADTVAIPRLPGLFIIGNDRGMLRPCGCSKPVLGGIARRGAFFDTIERSVLSASALVAAGNIVAEGGRQQELKIEAFLDSMKQMEVDVFCPLDMDLLVGTAFWTELTETRAADDFPIVSLNLLYQGQRLFDSHAVVRWRGTDVVVTGITSSENLLSEPGLAAETSPDVSDILTALASPSGPRPLLVVGSGTLADLEATVERLGLSKAASTVMLALAGYSDLPVADVDKDRLFGIETGQKGRDVAWTSWPAERELHHYTLGETWGENPEQSAILEFYRGNVKFEQLIFQVPKFDDAEGGYAGSDACAGCHAEAHGIWRESGHARAFDTLKKSGDDWDPECVRCHVVDFDRVGGFDPAAREPIHVQCEACHGPAQNHIETQSPTPRGRLGETLCISCHDLANSPKFTFESYWPRIAHGK